MPYLLRSDGTNDTITLPSGCISNAGNTDYAFWIKGTLRTTPAGLTGILGTSLNSNSNGFAMNATLQFRVYTAGTNRYGSGDNFFEVGVYHHYRVEHDSGGAWRMYRDNMSTPVSSGTFTTSTFFAQLNQMLRSSNASVMYGAWDIEEIGITSSTFSETYQADLSGGTGSIFPTVSGNNQGTLTNFPTDDSEWIFYSTAVSWSGTINKTSLTLTNKALFTSLGYSQSINKASEAISNKALIVAAGYRQTINKNTLTLSTKQLSVQAGTSVSFTGLLNKSNYPLTYKTLATQLGWSGSNGKQSLVLDGLPEDISAGFEVETSKSTLIIDDKQLSLTAGSSISFIGLLNKTNYPVNSKPLNVKSGYVSEIVNQSIPIQLKELGLEAGAGISLIVGKSSLTLTGKALGLINGQILSAQKRTLTLTGKQLSLGEIEYPVVPVERIFTIEHKNTTYILKQTINIHVMSQPIQTYKLKG